MNKGKFKCLWCGRKCRTQHALNNHLFAMRTQQNNQHGGSVESTVVKFRLKGKRYEQISQLETKT